MFYLYWLNIDRTLSKVLDKIGCHDCRANPDVANDLAAHYLSLPENDGYSVILVKSDPNLHGTREPE